MPNRALGFAKPSVSMQFRQVLDSILYFLIFQHCHNLSHAVFATQSLTPVRTASLNPTNAHATLIYLRSVHISLLI